MFGIASFVVPSSAIPSHAMLPPGVALAVAAALAFGGYLVAYKRAFADLPATVYVAANEAAALGWYAVIAAVTWPTGEPLVPPGTGLRDGLLVAGVGLAAGAATLVSIRAFKLGEVSYVAPLNKLVPVFVLPLELLVLAERLGPLQVVGVLVATAAIYVANYEGGGALAPFRRAAGYTPARLALGGAVLFAVADVGTRAALSTTALVPQAVALATLVGVTLVSLPFAASRLPESGLRESLPGLVALAAVFAVAIHLAVLAFDAAPASVVSPVVNTQAVVAVVLGGLLLGERGLGRRLLAALLAVAGVALIAAG
ncbi:EamA family transporter [Haloglomus litoreum]|uniref:EamA family transporter n=1 Tax=Haloglomus litoreum TaxID=3034026 RepID=UPI0023E8C66E|nr:EamA family transporter [Haloglomus sp. DT116]